MCVCCHVWIDTALHWTIVLLQTRSTLVWRLRLHNVTVATEWRVTEVPIIIIRVLRLLLQSEIALELLLLVLLGERLVAHPIDTRRCDIGRVTAASVRFRHGGATGPWLSRFVSEVGLVVCLNLSII